MERALFGKLAVEMRYLSPEQLSSVLAIQRRETQCDRRHRPIGQICIEEGLLSMADLMTILEHQGLMTGGCR